MRTSEDILNLANMATYSVLRRASWWTTEDRADMRQEAALAIWQLPADAHDGTCFVAAKYAIYAWMRRWSRHPPCMPLLEDFDVAIDDTLDTPRALDYLDVLEAFLREQRAEKPARDVEYLRLLLSGATRAGIAQEMGIPQSYVATMRLRLIARLERIAAGKAPPAKPAGYMQKHLKRVNSDPEILARRNAAIRAAHARRKQRLAEQAP